MLMLEVSLALVLSVSCVYITYILIKVGPELM